MLHATGFVRRLDHVGRIVIPAEIRAAQGLSDADPIEIFQDDDGRVVLVPYRPGCLGCGNVEDLAELGGARICKLCATEVLKLLDPERLRDEPIYAGSQ